MKSEKRKEKKGILLTLLTVVLFVLMLSEVITYVIINVNYSALSQSASSASAQGSTTSLIVLSATSLLHSSLSSALGAITKLESNPSVRGQLFINNTNYWFVSIMTNGTLYGKSLSSYMGSALMDNLSNVINERLGPQGISVTIQGGNLTIFQGSYSTINATYTAELFVSTANGNFTYPLRATTSVSLNATQSIPALEQANPIRMPINPSYPSAVMISNSYAISGSTGPFQFAYGTAVVLTGGPTCSNVIAGDENSNYILVVANALGIGTVGGAQICGMGGLIANVLPSAAAMNVPYLQYASTSTLFTTFNTINGTQVLLDGKGLAVYNISALKSAITNVNFYGSNYLPSYLDQAQSALVQRFSKGLWSFNLLNRQVPYFSDVGSVLTSNIMVTKGNVILPPTFTISFWFYKDPNMQSCDDIVGMPSSVGFEIYTQTANGCSAGSTQETALFVRYVDSFGTSHNGYGSIAIPSQTWTQATLVFGVNTITWYINGNKVSTYTGLTNPGTNTNSFIIGSGDTSFNGSISNVQVYNTPLTPSAIEQIYLNGITAYPTATSNLIAWYPLNGNGNDYSGYNRNGTATSVVYRTLNGYWGDPIYRNPFSYFNTSEVEGAQNCANINQCTLQSMSHLYLGTLGLATGPGGSILNESTALGLGNAILPRVLSFANNNYVQEKSSFGWLESSTQPYSVSIWVYPTTGNGVVLDEYNASSNIHNPWISISGSIVSIDYGGGACTSIGSVPLNSWSDIALTLSPGTTDTFNGYVNGAQRFTTTSAGTRTVLAASAFYNLGKADSASCGQGAYNGLMADFQVYNTALTPSNVLSLYLNDSVPGMPANILMPLNKAFNNVPNETTETRIGNFGIFYSGNVICSVANVINGECGLSYVPP